LREKPTLPPANIKIDYLEVSKCILTLLTENLCNREPSNIAFNHFVTASNKIYQITMWILAELPLIFLHARPVGYGGL
jgi:hypothetical protein